MTEQPTFNVQPPQLPPKKKVSGVIIALIIIAILLFGCIIINLISIFFSGQSKNPKSTETKSESVTTQTSVSATESTTMVTESTMVTSAPTTTATETTVVETTAAEIVNTAEEVTLGAGTFTVGEDIKPGRYEISANQFGNFTIYSESGSLLTNELLGGDQYGINSYVTTLSSGDKIEISGISETHFLPYTSQLRSELTSGYWIVGVDIAPGRYVASTTDGLGNFTVYSPAGRLKVNELLGSDEGYVNNLTVSLEENQLIVISGLKIVTFAAK